MKRILITGKNSYIGKSFQTWLAQYPEEYEVEAISVRGDEWKDKDFSRYDVVYHVAGIAHIKETKKNEELYYQVNRDLAVAVANKAKNEGVKQFIFLSSMSVYGLDEGIISKDTPLKPRNAYGKSKMEAENAIKKLSSDFFKVLIVRPPMVYGKKCTGNYKKLSELAKKIFIFPNIDNQRSMIYIDNLSFFIKLCIVHGVQGIVTPQNSEYVSTSEMVVEIARVNNKNIYLINKCSKVMILLSKKNNLFSKVFGSLIYDKSISSHEMVPRKANLYFGEVSFLESIKESEK